MRLIRSITGCPSMPLKRPQDSRRLACPPHRNLGVRGLPAGVRPTFMNSFPSHSGQSRLPEIQFAGRATGRPPLFTRDSVLFASKTLFALHQIAESTTDETSCDHVSVTPS